MVDEKPKDPKPAVATPAPRKRGILPFAIVGAVLVLGGSAGAYVSLAPKSEPRQTIFAYKCKAKDAGMVCAPFSIVDQ